MMETGVNEEIGTIINSSPAIIFLWKNESDWPVEFVSDNILQFGYAASEFLDGNLNYADIIHPDDLKGVEEELSIYATAPTQKGFTRQYRIVSKFGDARWVDERSLIRRDDDGKITHIQGIIIDVTESKEAEEKLLLNEARLETLLKLNQMREMSVKEIMDFTLEETIKITKSKVGYLALVNPSENVITMNSWSQRTMSECIIEDKQLFHSLNEASLWEEAIRKREAIINNEYDPTLLKNNCPGGHVNLVRHMNVPVYDGEKIVALAGMGNKEYDYDETDVKQLKLLVEAMWKIIYRKELIDTLKTISTEFEKANNELKSIKSIKKEFIMDKEEILLSNGDESFIERETLDSLNEQQDKAVEIAIKNSEKLKSMVDSILYINMEESGKISYNPSDVNVLHTIDNAILNVILEMDEKNISITKNVPSSISIIEADKEKLTDVFSRIIESSIQFTPPNGNITISAFEDDLYVHFELKDNGMGIPEPIASNILTRFYQVQDPDISSLLNELYEDLKSSLHICKNIIEAHGGRIWFKSEEGIGTNVHVRLPKKAEQN